MDSIVTRIVTEMVHMRLCSITLMLTLKLRSRTLDMQVFKPPWKSTHICQKKSGRCL